MSPGDLSVIAEAASEELPPLRAPEAQSASMQQQGRLKLRPWLEEQIQSGRYPGVSWLDKVGTSIIPLIDTTGLTHENDPFLKAICRVEHK